MDVDLFFLACRIDGEWVFESYRDLYVGEMVISNIRFLRGAHSWDYFYEIHANAFIRY